MNKEHLFDELGRIERDVVHGERQLAEQEELLVALKKSERGLAQVQSVLEDCFADRKRSSKSAFGFFLYCSHEI